MKGLRLARLCRPDLSYAVGRLASRITVWSRAEDIHLHRLVSYVSYVHTRDFKRIFQAGARDETEVHVFADADLASCVRTARSASGMLNMLVSGPSRWPIEWNSRRQHDRQQKLKSFPWQMLSIQGDNLCWISCNC